MSLRKAKALEVGRPGKLVIGVLKVDQFGELLTPELEIHMFPGTCLGVVSKAIITVL